MVVAGEMVALENGRAPVVNDTEPNRNNAEPSYIHIRMQIAMTPMIMNSSVLRLLHLHPSIATPSSYLRSAIWH